MTQPLIDFYSGYGTDHQGRMLADIIRQDDAWLERTHDYIQWLFPNRGRSTVTPNAPVLDSAARQAFQSSELMQRNLRAALARMVSFLGLQMTSDGIDKATNWVDRKGCWFTVSTHNGLRITRILKCLQAVGMTDDAETLLAGLRLLYETEPDCDLDPFTMRFWRDAASN